MQDLRLAIRSLAATPLVTCVAVVSLALGIGANTAIFSLINVLLVRPLPVAAPERLAVVSDTRGISRGFTETWPYAVWEELRTHAQPFDGVCAWWGERLNLSRGGGEEHPVDALWVSGDYFSTLGVSSVLGRSIGTADDVAGAPPVAVVSYEFWQTHFGGAAAAIGSSLTVERVPFTIVGVTPPAFFGAEVGRAFDIALPLHAEAMVRGGDSRLFNRERPFSALMVLVRLKPEQSTDSATTMLRGLQPQVRTAAIPANFPPAFRSEFLKDPFVVLPAATGISRLRTRYEQPLMILLVIVSLVLAIACGNIANLQLARGIARQHELAVRLALGASRWRLVRAWLIESAIVSAVSAIAGVAFAGWSSRLIASQLSTVLNHVYLDVRMDWRVLGFTLVATVITTVLFGVLPAVRATTVAPCEALKEQGRVSMTAARVRLSNALVVAQVALSVIIVVAAGLFVRTFQTLATVPLGFDSGRVLLVSVKVPRSVQTATDKIGFVQRLAHDVAGLPGVANAAASAVTPIGGVGMVAIVHVPGSSASADLGMANRLGPRNAYVNFITPGWFATYGIPITVGRDFTDRDTKSAPAVIIVNDAFVRKFVPPDKDPIGTTVAFEQGRTALSEKTIVGVVPDAVYGSVRNVDEAAEYAPVTQMDFGLPPVNDGVISVRAAAGSPMLLARSVSAQLATADPDLVFGFRLLKEQVDSSLTQERLVAMLSGFLGALALFLAGLGLYGIAAYSVVRRRSEIAIRMALGSTSARVSRAVVARALSLVVAGIAVGLIASLWASRFVATLLFGIDPHDPPTLVGAVVTLFAVALVASWVPAARASQIDPAEVLRES